MPLVHVHGIAARPTPEYVALIKHRDALHSAIVLQDEAAIPGMPLGLVTSALINAASGSTTRMSFIIVPATAPICVGKTRGMQRRASSVRAML